MSTTMPECGATIFVCISCRRRAGAADDAFDLPGMELVAALEPRLAGVAGVKVEPIECLAVCKRPCTLALTAPRKWTYLIGDLDPERDIEEIAAAAMSYSLSEHGIVAWSERPPAFRRGVVARVPPQGFVQPVAEAS